MFEIGLFSVKKIYTFNRQVESWPPPDAANSMIEHKAHLQWSKQVESFFFPNVKKNMEP